MEHPISLDKFRILDEPKKLRLSEHSIVLNEGAPKSRIKKGDNQSLTSRLCPTVAPPPRQLRCRRSDPVGHCLWIFTILYYILFDILRFYIRIWFRFGSCDRERSSQA